MELKIRLTLLLLIFSTFSFAVDTASISEHFRLREDIRDETVLTEDINIFFKNSILYYDLPGKSRPGNILATYEIYDPLEGYNRCMFEFNSALTGYVLRPIGEGFNCIFPEYVRDGISRMANNIEVPGRVINTVLQGRLERTGVELARFFINTTVGILGFYDPAESWWNMERQANSFGRTFEYWGMGPGYYVVLPIQGSTNLRDGIGLIGDWFADPITWIPPLMLFNPISLGIKAFLKVNDMTLIMDDYVKLYESSNDPYYTLKMLYTMFNHMEILNIENSDKGKKTESTPALYDDNII